MSAAAQRWADPRRHFAAMTAAARRWAVPRWDLASMTAAARRHWLILAILAPAIALRVLAQLAYKPLLLYIDSYVYLGNLHRLDPTGDYPIGYDLFLRPVLWLGNLAVLAAIQHLLGLGMGVAIYLLLLRRGVRRWLAALAAAPVLLDAYQVQLEHNLMADTLFMAMLVAVVAVLTWNRRPGFVAAASAGVLLGAAVVVRLVGEPLVLAAILFVAVAGSGRWRRLGLAVTVAACFAVPIGAYAGFYHSRTGTLGISATGGAAAYGRVVSFVDCSKVQLPAYERVLCPTQPLGHRADADYLVHAPNAPRFKLQPPPGMSRAQVERDFARRVAAQQPLELLGAFGRDFAKGFAPARITFAGDVSVDRWWFPLDYPVWPPGYPLSAAVQAADRYGGGGPAVLRPIAELLRDYQRGGYTPGPVMALALLAGLLGALGAGRTRDSSQRAACLLYTTMGAGVLLSAATFEFSWRYQLPGLVLLPLGGALGATILFPGRRRPPVPSFPTDVDRQALRDFDEHYGKVQLAPVAIVIAAYDEADAIGPVLDAIPGRSCGLDVDTLVVVDGATDATAEVARRHGAYTCEVAVNRGQGAALRLGYHLAREGAARYVVTTDADGQYDLDELPRLLLPLIADTADFVTGSRALGNNHGAVAVRRLGSHVFAWLVSALTGQRVSDTSFGFRAMRAHVTGSVNLSQRQYQSAELLIGVLARGFRVLEQPMTMRARTTGRSKKGNSLVYGWSYARVVLGTWLRERPGRDGPPHPRSPGRAREPAVGDRSG
jgi:Glycosyl transferase family 2